MEDAIGIHCVTGAEILPFIPDAARLRITVFREYPYLYDGTMEYEETYLRTYSESAGSLFVIARDGDSVVGVSTAMPLAQETEEVHAPVSRGRHSCGGSLLLWRKRPPACIPGQGNWRALHERTRIPCPPNPGHPPGGVLRRRAPKRPSSAPSGLHTARCILDAPWFYKGAAQDGILVEGNR
jgi:hypothetical protein